MYHNNNYLHLHTPTSLPSPRHHPRPHALNPNFSFPPAPPQPNFHRRQPYTAPLCQKSHARSNTLQFNPEVLDLHSRHDLPLLNTSDGSGFGERYVPAGVYKPNGKPITSVFTPQNLTPGLASPRIDRAWTCDPSTPSAISPLTLSGFNPFPVSWSPISFDSRSHSKGASTAPPLALLHAPHNAEWRSGTGPEAHDRGKTRFYYYDDLPEREYKGLRGRIGGPPKAILGGPGGKTFDEMMAEKEKSRSPAKSLSADPFASTPAQELKSTTPSPGAEAAQQALTKPITPKDKDVMVPMPSKQYNAPDSPPSTLLANNEKDAKSDTSGESRLVYKEAFPRPSPQVQLSPERTPLLVSSSGLTPEDLGEAVNEALFPSVQGERDGTWKGKKVIVSHPGSVSGGSHETQRADVVCQDERGSLEGERLKRKEMVEEPEISPKEVVSEMLRAVSDDSEEERMLESSQRGASADMVDNATSPGNISRVMGNHEPKDTCTQKISPVPVDAGLTARSPSKTPFPLSIENAPEEHAQLSTPDKYRPSLDPAHVNHTHHDHSLVSPPNTERSMDSSTSSKRSFNGMAGAFARRQLGDILKPKANRDGGPRVSLRVSATPSAARPPLSPQDPNIVQHIEKITDQLKDERCNAYTEKDWNDDENEKLTSEDKREKRGRVDGSVVEHVEVESIQEVSALSFPQDCRLNNGI